MAVDSKVEHMGFVGYALSMRYFGHAKLRRDLDVSVGVGSWAWVEREQGGGGVRVRT